MRDSSLRLPEAGVPAQNDPVVDACPRGATPNVLSLVSLVERVRLTRLTRLNRRRESCTGVSCPQPTGNGCRLAPELDATRRRGGHGEPRVAPVNLVPDLPS